MTVRLKTTAVLTAAMLVAVAALWAAAWFIVLPEFDRIELRGAAQDARRAVAALNEEATRLGRIASDWSLWDDTYSYMETLSPRYVESNLTPEGFVEIGADIMVWVSPSGQAVLTRTLEADSSLGERVPDGLRPWLVPGSPLVSFPSLDATVEGVVLIQDRPLIVASRPIVTTSGEGPSRGTYIVGRFLTPEAVAHLGAVTHLALDVRRASETDLPPDFVNALRQLTAGAGEVVTPLDRKRVASYGLVRDVAGKPCLVVGVTAVREVHRQGVRTLHYLVSAVVVTSGLSFLITLLLLERQVLSRLRFLGRDLARVGTLGDLKARIAADGTDEIASLARSANEMLDALGRSQREREESAERYLALVHSAQEGILIFDAETRRVVEANPSFLAMFGYTAEEMAGLTIYDISAHSRETVDANIGQVLGEGTAEIGERTWRCRDGSLLDVAVSGCALTVRGRRVLSGIVTDITERKRGQEALRRAHDELERRVAERTADLARANEALRASELRYRSLVENVNDVIFVLDRDGIITYVSPVVERLFGYNPDEIVGQPIERVVHPDDFPEVFASFERTLAGSLEPSEFRLVGKNGQHRFVRTSSRPILEGNTPAGMRGILTDLTDRKRAEEALRASEERFRTLVESQGEGVVVLDHELRFEFANPAAEKLLGMPTEVLVEHALPDFLGPEDAARIQGKCEKVRCGEPAECELELRRPDGERRAVAVTATLWIAPASQPAGTLAILRDITQEREARDRINLLASTVRSIKECVSITDLEDHVIFVNQAFLDTYGYRLEELIGRSIALVRPAKTPAETGRGVHQATLDGGWTGELVNRRKDGTEFPVSLATSQLHDDNGELRGLIGIATDITERRRLEEQLRLSQRMEAIGHLAGGIAHDFNNLLTVLVGTNEIIRRGLPPESKLHEEIETSQRVVEEAAKLTRGLLAYARRQRLEPQDLDFSRAVGEMVPMLRRVLPENIGFSYLPSDDAITVRADRGQLEQVLMNLVVNARDAMSDGGQLTITTTAVTLGDEFLSGHPFGEPGRYAKISVSDTGMGMDEETLERIFDPFFTTKELGRGTGLGLATVYGIVKQHGGIIDVSSTPGHGTTFDVYLPMKHGTVAAARKETPRPAVGRGSETILLVEDQEDIRKTVAKFLEYDGYRVLEAADGAEALALLERGVPTVGLVFSDLVMPGVGGWELYTRCRELGRQVPFLFCSGHDERLAREGFTEGETIGFIPKPYDLVELTRRIREMLEREGGAAPPTGAPARA